MKGKRKFIQSVLSLVLCLALFVGATLAWYTDTITLDKQELWTDTLGVDFLKYNEDEGSYISLKGKELDNIFADSENGLYWYPGRTEILYLQVENIKNLPLKYNIVLNISGADPEGMFEYAILDGVPKNSVIANDASLALDTLMADDSVNIVEKWTAIKAAEGAQTGKLVPGTITAAENGYLPKGESDYFVVAINMSPDADNSFQGKDILIDIGLKAVQDDGEFDKGPNLDTSVSYNLTFEENMGGLNHSFTTNTTSEIVYDGVNDNHYVLASYLAAGQSHSNLEGIYTASDYVVYEMDFNIMNEETSFQTYGQDANKVSFPMFAIHKGDFKLNTTAADGTVTKYAVDDLTLNEWHRFSAVANYFAGTVDYYLDGEFFAQGMINEAFSTTNKIVNLRINHRTIYFEGYEGGTNTSFEDNFQFGYDNIRIYGGMVPVAGDVGKPTKVINLTGESVFDDDEDLKRSLMEYTSVHKRSGIVFVNGEKYMLPTLPAADGTKTMIQTAELAGILGVTLPSGTAASMDLEEFYTNVLGKQVYTDATTVNSGMVIAGDSVYAAPTDAAELQRLNNYLCFLRPDAEAIGEMYESSATYQQHPRIHATQDDFDALKAEYNSGENTYISGWGKTIIQQADKWLETDPVFYELRDGVRLLGVSREVLNKMYGFGMAYQLTGDQKYADRAYEDLKAVSEFADWHPSHDLDLAEMAAAVAIGYDWMYHAFTEEQRAVIEQGMYNNAFWDAITLYQTSDGRMRTGCYGESNWNTVISGGLMVAAMAMADVYPDVAYTLMAQTLRASENYFHNIAPLGAWYEGPGYWEYVMQYLVKAFNALETTLGTNLRLSTLEGLSTASRYIISLQGDQGVFTYGDGIVSQIYVPEMIWMGNTFDDDAVTNVVLNKKGLSLGDMEDRALAMLWLDPDFAVTDDISFPLDAWFESDQVVGMHDTYMAGDTVFAAYHAGDNSESHGHLDAGSFVFESDGVRWALELGQDNYNQEGYWDETDNGKRWQIFRLRAEAHNTLVINSTAAQDQEFESYSPITKFETKPRGTIVLSDLTDAYRVNATSAMRGIQFADDRKSLVIRDELTLMDKDGGNEVYWFMLTDSDVTINQTEAGTTGSVTLTKKGKTLTLDFVANQPGLISCDVAAPLNEETVYNTTETAKRIAIKFEGVTGDLDITVKLTPESVSVPTAVADYHKDMTTWTIKDGEMPEEPTFSTLKINGDDFVAQNKVVTYYYVEGSITAPPTIEATSENASVDIQYAETLADKTIVTLTDNADSTNVAKYIFSFVAIPEPDTFDGKTSIPAVGVVADIEPQVQNVAMNVIDGDLTTGWAGNAGGNNITLDLNTVQKVGGAAIAFAGGSNNRKYDFEIEVSANGVDFNRVYKGWSDIATGAYQQYDFTETDARYVRIIVNGSDPVQVWTTIKEVVIYRNAE